jgi:hypothetical protein
MKVVSRLLVLCLFAVVLTAIPAHAGIIGNCAPDDDTCTGPDNPGNVGVCQSMDTDQCMWASSTFSGAYFQQCTADKRYGQKCQAYLQDMKTLRKSCQGVDYSAGCWCDASIQTTGGTCTYK